MSKNYKAVCLEAFAAMVEVHDPDRELVQRIQKGDGLAFNQLVLKYRNRIMGLATRMIGDRDDAEDLAQDVFVKVYLGLRTFKHNSLFSTWLYRITANSCLNHKKKQKCRAEMVEATQDGELVFPDLCSNPHAILEKKELKIFLEKAIQALPREQRLLLILRDVEGLSYEEIADSLVLELGTVKSRLHRARLQIEDRLSNIFSLNGRGAQLRIARK